MAEDIPGIVRLRDRREAMTLRTILTAARQLFTERGYARSPIRLIAEKAGVAPQTIYAHFGSKAGVLTGLVDLMDEEAGLEDVVTTARTMTDPVEILALLAAGTRQAQERCSDILAILHSGAAVDPAIAATQAEGRRRNRIGIEMLIDRVRALGHPVDQRAADIVVALLSPGIHDSLVADSGWTYDDYEKWLTTTLVGAVLR